MYAADAIKNIAKTIILKQKKQQQQQQQQQQPNFINQQLKICIELQQN